MNRWYPYQSTPMPPATSATKNNELNTAVTSAMTILAAITTPATARTALSQNGICLPNPFRSRYDAARYVHFLAMATIVGFLVVHVVMAILVPKALRAMIIGR